MNQKRFVNIIVIIGVVILIGVAGYFIMNQQVSSPTPMSSPAPTPVSDETKCTNYSAVKLNDNQSFIYTYNSELRTIPEEKFEGILKEYKKLPPDVDTYVQRELTYNLDGRAIYTTKDDLSKYVGKRVILTGKNYKFELEGTQRDEIWPVNIVCK